MSLCDANIFHARQILRNFNAKKSAFIDNQRNYVQIFCLVNEKNEILVYYKYYGELNNNNRGGHNENKNENEIKGASTSNLKNSAENNVSSSNWKIIVWFQKNCKQIQDLCFDSNGSQLLVICYDNTLHIVPILWIINSDRHLKTTTSQEIENFYWPFRSDEITSFIVPFSGPHECSNAKTCPNNESAINENNEDDISATDDDKYTPAQINETVLSNNLYQTFYLNERDDIATPEDNSDTHSVTEKSPDGCEKSIISSSIEPDLNKIDDEEKVVVNLCPFPTAVVWWVTSKGDEQTRQHRAIIGYSDGSICVVGLTPNCPFIANTAIDSKCGGIQKMTICRDPIVKSVSLLINSLVNEQWKLLLEQNSIGYIFPDDIQNCLSKAQSEANVQPKEHKPDDWQIIIPVPNESSNARNEIDRDLDEDVDVKDDFQHLNYENGQIPSISPPTTNAGIFPAARARLASLRDLGAKKIGALKLKLIENKIKSNERDRSRQQSTQLACMEVPSFLPEVLTTPAGPFFFVQCLKGAHLLSALHPYSDTLSVHSMDISLIPLHIYKIPKNCSDVLITPYIMFTKQMLAYNNKPSTSSEMPANVENCENIIDDREDSVNAINVIACNSTALEIGEDSEFNESAILGSFKFPDEIIQDIHRVPFYPVNESLSDIDIDNCDTIDSSTNTVPFRQPKIATRNYVTNTPNIRVSSNINDEHLFTLDDRSVIEHRFPIIYLDKCAIVTNKSVYFVEFRDHPHIIFLNLVRDGQWKACEEFCKVFELNFGQCVEYAGDVLLKKEKTTQALLTYNVAKIPPVKTALKLAMFGQNSALMHLCAMALKIVYILRSTSPKNQTIKYLLDTNASMHAAAEPKKHPKRSKNDLNCGTLCSDFCYDRDETPGDLQMSNPSQFHLSNLLLLTLTEKAIKDKNYMPLWNFLVTNKRYHTNMSSIVLAQSGLYASTIVLALNRGAHMDAYCALVGVTSQEFGWYSEINEILHNLSDSTFSECVIYLQHASMDYFDCVQAKIDKINSTVLKRLKNQLDPFSAIFRPVVSQLSSNFVESDSNEINKRLIEFCRHLIETFLIVIIRLFTMSQQVNDDISNGLTMIYVNHEENQFAIKIENYAPISVGFSHCAAIVDGCCYVWGSNGINCALSISSGGIDYGTESTPRCLEFIAGMALEVHAVKCGKLHTLILTNNGLYSMGSNLLGQLGIGKHHIQALQPMLIPEFDGMNISLIEVGQYHNAIYADGVLYTWGWGIYGQLGHGNVFTEDRPKAVKLFKNKVVKQIALGHAHSLVLCGNKSNDAERTLYVFGCNLFGQLGTGYQTNDSAPNTKFIKSCVPIVIKISNETIIYIHTKYFSNYVVTATNKLYTWGASPQLIRLMNQANKRARLARKFEETKTTITNDLSSENKSNDPNEMANGKKNSTENGCDDVDAKKDINDSPVVTNLEERIKSFLKMKTINKSDVYPVSAEEEAQESTSTDTDSTANTNKKIYADIEEETTEHLIPSQVDTSEIVGEILHVSSGLYHNALVTSTSRLYTWGKNLEKQLGRENARCDLAIPTQLELNESIIYVECGADFTLILTDHFTVKAFGNNNFGQCGREMNIPNDRAGIAGKLVRLRSSKRVVRLPDSNQCVEQPTDIPLPRPKIRMNFDAVRYLKSVPKFEKKFIARNCFGYESNNRRDSDESCHLNSSESDGNQEITRKIQSLKLYKENAESNTIASDLIHYCLFIFHGIYDPHKMLEYAPLNEFKVRVLMLNYYVKEAFALCLTAAKTNQTITNANVHDERQELCNYVIKLFEYFTKDANIVPIHRTDLKFLIHAIFMYFIKNDLPLDAIEKYFLSNIDHYLFGLAFVLYFNNNNSKLECKVQQKYTHLFSGCAMDACTTNGDGDLSSASDDGDNAAELAIESQRKQNKNNIDEITLDFEVIFNTVSTSFKAIICQRLIEFDNELN